MIGQRLGSKAALYGSVLNSSADDEAPSSLAATKDATSGIYVPANNTEWTAVMAAAGISSGNPTSLWLCQEASGTLADSIGSNPMTLSGTGLTYQDTVAGWARKGIKWTDNLATFFNGPAVTGTSYLVLAYIKVDGTPAAERLIIHSGGETRVTTGPAVKYVDNGAGSTGSNPTGAVRPFTQQNNNTASIAAAFTDQDHLTDTWAAPSGGMFIGGVVETSPPMHLLYAAMWLGSSAEMTAAQIKTLQTTLGWSPTWT